jgi:hypothetical protein
MGRNRYRRLVRPNMPNMMSMPNMQNMQFAQQAMAASALNPMIAPFPQLFQQGAQSPLANQLANYPIGQLNPISQLAALGYPLLNIPPNVINGYQNMQNQRYQNQGYQQQGLTGLGGFNVQQGLNAFNLGLGAYAAAAAATRGQPLVNLLNMGK